MKRSGHFDWQTTCTGADLTYSTTLGLFSARDSGRSIPARSAFNYSRGMVEQRLKMRLREIGRLRPIRHIRDCEQADAAARAR
jgi:hypothetical protein